jgi:hypothetical protein
MAFADIDKEWTPIDVTRELKRGAYIEDNPDAMYKYVLSSPGDGFVVLDDSYAKKRIKTLVKEEYMAGWGSNIKSTGRVRYVLKVK